jgi:hypothetical protein
MKCDDLLQFKKYDNFKKIIGCDKNYFQKELV